VKVQADSFLRRAGSSLKILDVNGLACFPAFIADLPQTTLPSSLLTLKNYPFPLKAKNG